MTTKPVAAFAARELVSMHLGEIVVVVCDDGSVWWYDPAASNAQWEAFPPIPESAAAEHISPK